MPGLRRDFCDGLLACGITLDKAVGRGLFPKGLADAVVGKVRAKKVDLGLFYPKVNGKPRLVLTAAGGCDKLPGEDFPVFSQGPVVNLLLFTKGAPAAHRFDMRPAVDCAHEFRQQNGGSPLKQDAAAALLCRNEEAFCAALPVGMLSVH
ncbi:hypothetical protein SDC9_117202 [bioreactor metagenome]|uniref:Uncharacterized protein n=1 Tax=bioreactor metagenome TaxID=1076179 RepID=A0A645BYQ5_9ZZZZ